MAMATIVTSKEESEDTEDEPLIKSNSRRGSQIDVKAAAQVSISASAVSAASKAKKAKAEEPDDLDLACGETIPGSPVHPSSASTSLGMIFTNFIMFNIFDDIFIPFQMSVRPRRSQQNQNLCQPQVTIHA